MKTFVLASIAALIIGGPAIAADPAPTPVSEIASPDSFRPQAEAAIDPDKHPGKALFVGSCATCHEGGIPKAPHREFLQMMAPDAILAAMNSGTMAQMAAALSGEQRRQIAEYLTLTDLSSYVPPNGPVACTGEAARFDLADPPARVGWGYDTRRFVPASVAGLSDRDVPALKLKWAFAYPAAVRARSQPVVAMGAVFVGSQDGTVYAFDLETGCARWTSRVSSEVRTAIVVEPWPVGEVVASPRLFFGDHLGRVYAMDALTGRVLWQQRVDDHPNSTITGSVVLHEGALYVPVSSLEVTTAADPNYACCTFRGSVIALDAATGAVRWRHYTVERPAVQQGQTRVGTRILGPSGAPVWTTPTIDARRGVLYHGSGENYSTPADDNSDAVFAVDLATGKRVWAYQTTPDDAWNGACMMQDHPNCPRENGPDFDIAASAMLVSLDRGRQALIVGPKSGEVLALDPDDKGKLLWKTRVGRGGIQGGVHFGMAAEGARIFVPIVDLDDGNDGKVHATPGFAGLHALDARTGRILWRAMAPRDVCDERKYCDPGISAAVIAMPGVVFAGALDGRLRAYDSAAGRVMWETDTLAPVEAVNGEIARGGSIGGPGPIVAKGHLIVNSGYGIYSHMAGNALLVYAPDKAN